MKIKDKYLFFERFAKVISLLLIWLILLTLMTATHNNSDKVLSYIAKFILFLIGSGLTKFTFYRYSYEKWKKDLINYESFKKRFLNNLYFLFILNTSIFIIYFISLFNQIIKESDMTSDYKLAFFSWFVLISLLSLPNILFLYFIGKKFIGKNNLPKWLNNLIDFFLKLKLNFENSKLLRKLSNHSKSLNEKEIIIIAIIIGTITFGLMSYIFGSENYYYKNIRINQKEGSTFIEFELNYMFGIIGFIVSSGLTYLFLSKKEKK